MLGRERRAILRHNLESRFVRYKEDETGRFALWIGFAQPAIALTTERYHGSLLGGLGMACKLSTDLNQVPRAAGLVQQSIPAESVKGARIVGAWARIFREIWVTDFAGRRTKT